MIVFKLNRNFYIRKRDALLKKLKDTNAFINGSLVEVKVECGKKCRCRKGEKHSSYYLTDKVNGKTRTVYVPDDLVDEVEKWVEEYQNLKELLQEITELQRVIIRKYVEEKKFQQKALNYQKSYIKPESISFQSLETG